MRFFVVKIVSKVSRKGRSEFNWTVSDVLAFKCCGRTCVCQSQNLYLFHGRIERVDVLGRYGKVTQLKLDFNESCADNTFDVGNMNRFSFAENRKRYCTEIAFDIIKCIAILRRNWPSFSDCICSRNVIKGISIKYGTCEAVYVTVVCPFLFFKYLLCEP